MRRKPAILLFLLVLLLSISGAALYHHLHRETPPDFREVDAFLRELPSSTDRELYYHQPLKPTKQRNRGWWDRVGIRLEDDIQGDVYHFRRAQGDHAALTPGDTPRDWLEMLAEHPDELRKQDAVLFMTRRRNGKIDRVGVIGPPGSADSFLARFPELRRCMTQHPLP